MPCVVCTHPAASQINDALSQRTLPVLKLASTHELSRDALNWHRRKHLDTAAPSPQPAHHSTHAALSRVRGTSETYDRARQRFLTHYSNSGNITWSAKRAGIDRGLVYTWQEESDQFAAAFREADLKATEVLEREAWRRANEGIAEPVYQHGKLVGTIQRYSDNLLMFLLRARAPERYRDRVDVSVAPIIKSVAGFDPADVV